MREEQEKYKKVRKEHCSDATLTLKTRQVSLQLSPFLVSPPPGRSPAPLLPSSPHCFIKVNRPPIDATGGLLDAGLHLNYPFYLPPPPLAPLYPAAIRYPRALLRQGRPPDQPLVSGSMVPVGRSYWSLISLPC